MNITGPPHGGRRSTSDTRTSRTIKMPPPRSVPVSHREAPAHSTSAGGFTPSNCSPDFGFWQVGSRTVWTPVSGLELGLDILYNHINSGFAGPVTVSANGTVPSGVFNARDQDVLSGRVPNSAKLRAVRLSPRSNSTNTRPWREFCHHLFPPGPPLVRVRPISRVRPIPRSFPRKRESSGNPKTEAIRLRPWIPASAGMSGKNIARPPRLRGDERAECISGSLAKSLRYDIP